MRHIIFTILLFPSIVFAKSESITIAEVVKIRGEVTQLSPGAHSARVVALGDKFVEDTSIVTGTKSFVKIKFIDQSVLNIGPESKLIITEMKKDSVGIISLLKGRIRTEVAKDATKPDANKFFIKTRTAAMGVRGTDFQTIYNPENRMTSLLTYKGEVAMAKIDQATFEKLQVSSAPVIARDDVSKTPEIKKGNFKKLNETEELNLVLNKKDVVLVPPGQNSFTSDSLKKSSLPVKISPLQLEALYKNKEMETKTEANIKLQSGSDANLKPLIVAANQLAPAEGMYNQKNGDFAPRSGGFIDINTGLYVAPTSDAKFDDKKGVYVDQKIGDIDADTGQYVAPIGLTLDAKKGFVFSGDSNAAKKPELLALREDMNQSIARDIVVPGDVEEEKIFNIKEKFIRDRFIFSLWSLDQELTLNENSTSAPYNRVNSHGGAARLSLEWQMATNNRFGPLVGIDYSIIKFHSFSYSSGTQDSNKLLGLSYGFQYAMNKNFNFYSKFGLHQEHYIDQTSSGVNNVYAIKKIVITRLTTGFSAEFWRNHKWSVDANAGGIFTFRKRINSIVINEGAGLAIEVLPKYKLSDKKWLALGLKIENQFQRVDGTVAINRENRSTSGLEFKYISDF